MSAANVEIIRRIFEAAGEGNTASLLSLYDPDVELVSQGPFGELVGSGTYRGHEGVRRFFRAYYDAWEHVDYEVESLTDAGDQVISRVTTRARGRASGVEVEQQVPGVWTLRNGRVVHVVFFPGTEKP